MLEGLGSTSGHLSCWYDIGYSGPSSEQSFLHGFPECSTSPWLAVRLSLRV